MIDPAVFDIIAESRSQAVQRGQKCKWCNCFAAIRREDKTIIHVRDRSGAVRCETIYEGKLYCQMCHRFSATGERS